MGQDIADDLVEDAVAVGTAIVLIDAADRAVDAAWDEVFGD